MTTRRWGQREAALGAAAVVVLLALFSGPAWAGWLLVWVPMVAAVVVARYRRGDGESDAGAARIRFRITGMDLLVGAFTGLLLRTIAITIELLGVGHITSSASMIDTERGLLWLATAIIAPVIIAPIVEELFFRGLVLPAIGTTWIGIVGSAIIFSAVHLASGFHPVTAISTLIVGLVLGYIAVRTRRLGATITAHIVYNASLVAMSELGGLAPIVG